MAHIEGILWDVEYSEKNHKLRNKFQYKSFIQLMSQRQGITLKSTQQFMKEDVRDTELMFAPCKTMVVYEPLGVSLIFGSWNYPYIVTLKPLCQAITSGNCAVVKPSEMAPATSALMKKLVEKYLDNDCYTVIEGGVEVASKICHYPWDLICFTGSTIKGKLF